MSDPYAPPPPQPPGGSPPSPYGLPYPGYYPQPPHAPQPTRRSATGTSKSAAVVMALLALATLLTGGLLILSGVAFAAEAVAQMQADGNIPPEVVQASNEANISILDLVRIYVFVVGGLLVAYALVVGILSPFVWGRRLFPVIMSMIVLALVTLLAGLLGVAALVAGGVGMFAFMLLIVGVHLTVLVLLGLSLKNGQPAQLSYYGQGYPHAGYPQQPVYGQDVEQQQAAWRAYYEQSAQPPRDRNDETDR